MTEAQKEELLSQMKPEPVMKIGNHWSGMDLQERANRAWEKLGKEMGFDSTTVQPREGYGMKHFSAVSSETDDQRKEREAREAEEKKVKERVHIQKEIENLTARLRELNTR